MKIHVASPKHRDTLKVTTSTHSLQNFFIRERSTDNCIIKVECLMVNFLVEHNLPIAISDHLSPLMQAMFPDSKIASSFASKQRKTTHILHELAKDCVHNMSAIIKNNVFSIFGHRMQRLHLGIKKIIVFWVGGGGGERCMSRNPPSNYGFYKQ